MVRQAILDCYKELLTKTMSDGKKHQAAIDFGKYLICKAAEYGEKYDQNLVYLADIALQVAEQYGTLGEEA